MRDDLCDAYGALNWVKPQIPVLDQEFKSWLNSPPFLIVEYPQPEIGKKLFKLKTGQCPPPTFNAGVGVVINSIRSSLDLLASALAIRNGVEPCRYYHFPICDSLQKFIARKKAAKHKEWLSERDRKIIEDLKPYRGGNDLLFALHNLDIKRKHERLIRVELAPHQFLVPPDTIANGFEFPPVWPGFKDGAIIGWTRLGATKCDFQIAVELVFNETDFIDAQPVIPLLCQFADMARTIIQSFDNS